MISNPITNSLDKAELLNQQFNLVFTNESGSNLPEKDLNSHPTMSEISLTCQEIENLLNSLQTEGSATLNFRRRDSGIFRFLA